MECKQLNVSADVNQIFASLYIERNTCKDIVTFRDVETSQPVESAHDFVCSLQSPVLKTMLASSLLEGNTRTIDIQAELVDVGSEYCFQHSEHDIT